MPEPVIRAIKDHLTLEGRIGGYEAEETRADAIQAAYQAQYLAWLAAYTQS